MKRRLTVTTLLAYCVSDPGLHAMHVVSGLSLRRFLMQHRPDIEWAAEQLATGRRDRGFLLPAMTALAAEKARRPVVE